MIRILIITQTCGPDYLSDLIFTGIAKTPNVKIDTNHIAAYHWNDYPDLSKIYGRGFTAFGLLDRTKNYNLEQIKFEQIYSKIISKTYDYVIYSSIQRESTLVETAIDCLPPERIFLLDGEDNTEIIHQLIHKGNYFKREIIDKYKNIKIHPISFRIDQSKIYNGSIDKSLMLSICDPRDKSSYIFDSEADYYNGYRNSYFAVTMKKEDGIA